MSTVRFNNRFNDGQAKTGTLPATSPRSIGSIESVEYMGNMLGRYGRPRVLYLHTGIVS